MLLEKGGRKKGKNGQSVALLFCAEIQSISFQFTSLFNAAHTLSLAYYYYYYYFLLGNKADPLSFVCRVDTGNPVDRKR